VKLGADALVVTGHEAAAHGADATSLILIPLVASMVNVPLIAAGGFYDGRGLAAALALGASGISMGTRFILTEESIVHDNYKQLCLQATEQDTLYSNVFDGMPGRALKSAMAENMMEGDSFTLLRAIPNALKIKKILKQSWGEFMTTAWAMMVGEGQNAVQMARMANGAIRHQKAIYEGDIREGFMYAGQAIGAIQDLPKVKDLVDRIIAEAEDIMQKAPSYVV
jgi:enoyl-[acyl-carrier protein] reductase II